LHANNRAKLPERGGVSGNGSSTKKGKTMEGFPLWLKVIVYLVVGVTLIYPVVMIVSTLLG
jgi:hypothetical protein